MINVLLYLGILGLLIFHFCCYQICISNICLHPARSTVIYESTDNICTPCLNTPMLSLQNRVHHSLWPIFFLGHCAPQQWLQHRQFTWPSSAFDPAQQTHSFFLTKHGKFSNDFLLPRVDFKINTCIIHMYIYICTIAVHLRSGPGGDQTWAVNNITHFRVQVTDRSEWYLKDSHLSPLTQIYMLKGKVRWDESNPQCPNDPFAMRRPMHQML